MAANRKLPFGYRMQMGKVCIQKQEAVIVKDIYAAYARGASYRKITEYLNTQPVPYCEPGKLWNKNMVARILHNEAYTGSGIYPQIISLELRGRVSAVRLTSGEPTKDGRLSKAIRQISVCSECGGRLTLSATNRAWERWNCPSCGQLTAQAVTPRIKEGVSTLIKTIYETPKLLESPSKDTDQNDIVQMAGTFEQLLNTPNFQEDEAKAMALALAAARFDAFGSEDYETMRIQYLLAEAEPGEELNSELLQQITAAILIHPDGGISLKLKNGQIIERKCFT